MSPQEVINLRLLIEGKLNEPKTDKRVSALKSKRALQAVSFDDELTRQVEAVADSQIKGKGTISRSTRAVCRTLLSSTLVARASKLRDLSST